MVEYAPFLFRQTIGDPSMRIGVPRKTFAGECRVATTPDVAELLQKLGYSVAVEQ